ncbi:PaaI family thioesterase [Kordiimonas laminariae]|uniref:PaaI family thioesterase n=1 Tax=Kordiimonas laminariae TaxID=2917717 RepID=UPI001FF2008D|nr:PaaI family thioesterase [Kordiimonas laminariae]MCK0070984.1 PaaI family thioesterase [Kordiimonas laminariae]
MKSRIATDEMIAAANPPEGYRPIVSNSNFAWENGPLFEKRVDDIWSRGFRVAERHINAGGMCHGGMLMTFADIMLATAVMEVTDPPFVTVRLTTDFLGPAKLGDWVEGAATAHSAGDGLFSVAGSIWVGDKLVADASALFKAFQRKS